jgi:hypothetical protein
MAIRPSDKNDLTSAPAPLMVRVIGSIAAIVVALLLIRWLFGVLWTIIQLGIVVAVIMGAFYAYQQFTRSDD